MRATKCARLSRSGASPPRASRSLVCLPGAHTPIPLLTPPCASPSCQEEDVTLSPSALALLTEIGTTTSLRYALQLISPAHLVALRRRADNGIVDETDVTKVYGYFVDKERSKEFVQDMGGKCVVLLPLCPSSLPHCRRSTLTPNPSPATRSPAHRLMFGEEDDAPRPAAAAAAAPAPVPMDVVA